MLVFNGEDEDAVAAARARWSEAKAKGFEATYWQPDEQGRWVEKGLSWRWPSVWPMALGQWPIGQWHG